MIHYLVTMCTPLQNMEYVYHIKQYNLTHLVCCNEIVYPTEAFWLYARNQFSLYFRQCVVPIAVQLVDSFWLDDPCSSFQYAYSLSKYPINHLPSSTIRCTNGRWCNL